MKIAFMDVFEACNNAEEETTQRLKYCFEHQGHELFIINQYGYIINECEHKGKHIENTDIVFFYTFNHFNKTPILPNKLGIFFHWCPSGYLGIEQFNKYITNLYCFDDVFGGYESHEALVDAQNSGFSDASLIHIGSSVPKDFCYPPFKMDNRRLFYVGINLEKKLGTQRFGNLFKYLDKKNVIDIYGPNKVFGIKGCWDGYKNYKGPIPFDGKSVIEKINQAGIVLALNSPIHNLAGTVSNRTYEAAAGGAVIISNDNPYVHKYFGDSVFYVNTNDSEDKLTQEIINIMEWCNTHKEEALNKAKLSQKLFLQYLTLDDMVREAINKVSSLKDKKLYGDNIDIICQVDNLDEFMNLYNSLKEQTYQSLKIILLAPERVYNNINFKTQYPIMWIDSQKVSEIYEQALDLVNSPYFMFLDKWSDMQNRHIEKVINKLKNSDEFFTYSGSYIKKFDSYGSFYYQELNQFPIPPNTFCSFFNIHGFDIEKTLRCEEIFSKSCVIFKKSLLKKAENTEIKQISKAIHYYLALVSILKEQKFGCFTNTITAGYKLSISQNIENDIFPERYIYKSNQRVATTSIKELFGVFLKIKERALCYTLNNFQYTTKFEQKESSIDDEFYQSLKKNKFLFCTLSLLSKHKKKKYKDKRERIIKYLQNHTYACNFIKRFI